MSDLLILTAAYIPLQKFNLSSIVSVSWAMLLQKSIHHPLISCLITSWQKSHQFYITAVRASGHPIPETLTESHTLCQGNNLSLQETELVFIQQPA